MASKPKAKRVRCLVHVNVFEDVFRKRRGWRASEQVIRSVRRGSSIGYVSALTTSLIHYFRTQHHSDAESRRLTRSILRRFRMSLSPSVF